MQVVLSKEVLAKLLSDWARMEPINSARAMDHDSVNMLKRLMAALPGEHAEKLARRQMDELELIAFDRHVVAPALDGSGTMRRGLRLLYLGLPQRVIAKELQMRRIYAMSLVEQAQQMVEIQWERMLARKLLEERPGAIEEYLRRVG